MNIVLTGFMGTGKTAVGKQLARRLGWAFIDVDQVIEATAHMPVARIFSQRGEAVFRRLEQRVIRRLVHGHQQVISTGGGAFVDRRNRTILKACGPVICLTAQPKTILERVGRGLQTRPLLSSASDPLQRIRNLLRQRQEAYAQADLTVDTSDRSATEVTQQLWQELGPWVCRSWRYVLEHAKELSRRFGGKYVVVVDERIIASGETQLSAYRSAGRRLSERRDVGIYYIPLPEASVSVR